MAIETPAQQLIAALGADAVSDDAALCGFMGHDVFHAGGVPALVVRPRSIAALQTAVKICAHAGVAMVPRGGGASYTDGYLYAPGGHVLFDTGGLDSISIDADNAVVTVGPGVTWANLKAALDARGLRTPFWGPFSGLAATVGGSISQHTLSHGSAGFGISAGSVHAMQIVLASGEILNTGTAAATRYYGPDLTGLFTGDCGALGIKAEITLPLIAARPAFEAVSFAFADFASYHAGVQAAQRAQLDDSHFGLDIALSQGQIGKQAGIAAKLRIAAKVLRSAPGIAAGLRQLLRMAAAGDDALRAGAYMCHFIVEGMDTVEAAAKAAQLRKLLTPHGQESANSVPTFVRALPFAPLTNILGPGGERWVPLHGVLRHSDAVAFDTALAALFADHAPEMQRLGVWNGAMFSPVGPSGFLYEVALYWPDARSPYHETMLDPAFVATLPAHAANRDSRALVEQIKADIIALYQQFGAGHFQIGRSYPYRTRLDPQALALMQGIKRALDPDNLMNPGVLDLIDTI